MQKNDFLLINEIIYHIYTMEDFNAMRHHLLSLLSVLIPNKESSIFLSDHSSSSHLICDPVIFPCVESSAEQNYLQYETLDYTRWVMMSHKSMIYRESDLIPDEERFKTDFFKNLMEPNNLYFSLQLSLVLHDVSLGVITLYRTKEMGDFTDEEVFILDSLKEHLNYRFYQNYLVYENALSVASKRNDVTLEQFHLTKREQEIISHILNGLSNEVISEKLSISPHTLKKHTQNIYRKLHITNKWELFQYR